jgi:hypothetical protein
MIEDRDVQRCGHGCCIFVRVQPVTKVEYGEGVASGEIRRHTYISCLSDRGSKVVKAAADTLGFYFGLPDSSRCEDPHEGLVYDTKTHRYLRLATLEDARSWLDAIARRKASEPL